MNKHVLVAFEQETEIETKSGIVLTQLYKPSNHFRVLRIAADCKLDIAPNDFVMMDKLNKTTMQAYCIDREEQVYLIPASYIFGMRSKDGVFVAVGSRVVIKRWNKTEMDLDTKIIKPAFTHEKDQTLEGEVVSLGMLPDGAPWNTPIQVGDLVHLTKWNMDHIELAIGGEYHLVVKEKDISYIEHGRQSVIEY